VPHLPIQCRPWAGLYERTHMSSSPSHGLLWVPHRAPRLASCSIQEISPTSIRNGSFMAAGPVATVPALIWGDSWPGECTMCPCWPCAGVYDALSAAPRGPRRSARGGWDTIRRVDPPEIKYGSSSRVAGSNLRLGRREHRRGELKLRPCQVVYTVVTTVACCATGPLV
jgi:hypothetical protein